MLPPATSLHPAVLAAWPHLPGLSVGTLGICQLSESRLCAEGSRPSGEGPQSHRPSCRSPNPSAREAKSTVPNI